MEVANVKAGPAAFPDLNTINPKTRPSTLVRALAREEREHFETSRPEVRNTLALPRDVTSRIDPASGSKFGMGRIDGGEHDFVSPTDSSQVLGGRSTIVSLTGSQYCFFPDQ